MTESDVSIERLQNRLDKLVRTQIDFQEEVTFIRIELERLKLAKADDRATTKISETFQAPATAKLTREPVIQPVREPTSDASQGPTRPPLIGSSYHPPPPNSEPRSESAFNSFASKYSDSAKADLEKFIGENLISKIGIVILVLGVGIGTKYAIDSGWISPLMRVIFGYAMGLGLIGFAARLKPKYLNFSAVLLSGGMAILYFVTYFSYASYSLIGQQGAFGLMVIFTIFTVASAILYDRQVIAHIGLVGAYAVPFLLSTDSGNYPFLFTYMTLMNTGILAISVRKYWKSLFYTSSVFTWLIFLGWYVTRYSPESDFYLALLFLGLFFLTFYATKILHGVVRPESEDAENIICVVATSLIFYGFCFSISDIAAGNREYAAFFSYLGGMSLLILLTSYRFYGRILIYVSNPLTWLIFGAWFTNYYRADEHFVLAAVVSSIFFAVYYLTTLIYRLSTDEIGQAESVGLLLTNSFVFCGFGYALLDSREVLQGYLGLFTVAHAGFHSLISHIVGRIKSSAVDVVQVLTILVITFSTIAIPVQFDGDLVTLIWSVEAAVLFWFGRARRLPLFEYLSFPLMALATASLLLDWFSAYAERGANVGGLDRQTFANGDFITAGVFIAAFAFIYVTNRDKRYEPAIDGDLVRPFGYAIACIAILALYNTFRFEIDHYFYARQALAVQDRVDGSSVVTSDLSKFSVIWQLNYTIFFLTALSLVNLRKIRSSIIAYAGSGLSVLVIFAFLTLVLALFNELRISYVQGDSTDIMNIAIRYISYAFLAGLIYTLLRYKRGEIMGDLISAGNLALGFDAILYGTFLIVASCELVNLMGQFHLPDSTKLGLSILWGIYSVLLIVLGIAWNKKHLRIAAIVLLGVTLAKLFLYDIADLPTIPKTILFVSLGLLMLIMSFLYNKYKGLIFRVEPEQPGD